MSLFQQSFSQKLTALILLVAMLGLAAGPALLYPRKAQAQCPVFVAASAPTEKQTIADKIYEGFQNIYRNASLTEFITQSAILVWDQAQKLIEWAFGVLLNLLLHQILAMLTNDIVNWIQNGEEPRFLSMNLADWLGQAADNAIGAFIDQYLGAGWLCEPFDIDVKIALMQEITFEESVRCSLSDIVDNINDFYDDFSQGGWAAWIELTKPQNSIYGALWLAQAEKMSVEAIAREEATKDLEMGQGFLSPKDCTWFDRTGAVVERQTDVWGAPRLPAACRPDPSNPGRTAGGFAAPCDHKCQILTPASSVKRLTDKTITNYYDQLNAQIAGAVAKSGPYAIYVQAIVNALINRILTEGMGLLKAAASPSPQYGDTGASIDIPAVVDPQAVLEEINRAEALLTQLRLLRGNLETRLLAEQQNNLAVLRLVLSAYQDLVPLLNNVIAACQDTPYTSYIDWAQSQLNNINNNIIPSFNQRINQMETVDIPSILNAINFSDTAIISIQDYMNQANNWIAIYQNVNGDRNNPNLQAAEIVMNQARVIAREDSQRVIQVINGTVSSSDFAGLSQEAQQANANVLNQAANLELQRGIADFPTTGTLYGELEAANNLRDEANGYLITCNEYVDLGD